MGTRAAILQGAGATGAASTTQIGAADITLPSGGPWTIFGLWGMVAKVTAVAAEGTGGDLIVQAVAGDLTPDPSPGKYPLIGSPAQMGANHGNAMLPLNIWPVNWQASGKATIRLSYYQQLAITTAPRLAAGILFGDKIPPPVNFRFCDSVGTAFASATEQTVGSITLAEKAKRITGVMGVLNHGDTITVAEPMIGSFRLASSSLLMPPANFPFNVCMDSSDGTPAGETGMPHSNFIPVDIPIDGGAIIDVFATTFVSCTGNAEVRVYLAYE